VAAKVRRQAAEIRRLNRVIEDLHQELAKTKSAIQSCVDAAFPS